MSCATRRNLNAFSLSRAPAEAGLANAFSASVVVQRTFFWNISAVVSEWTPGCSSFKANAPSTSVGLDTALGNNSTRSGFTAPCVACLANTLTAVIMVLRTFLWNGETSISRVAEREASSQSNALAAVIVSQAAIGNINTASRLGAPRESWACTGTVSTEVMVKWTFARDC